MSVKHTITPKEVLFKARGKLNSTTNVNWKKVEYDPFCGNDIHYGREGVIYTKEFSEYVCSESSGIQVCLDSITVSTYGSEYLGVNFEETIFTTKFVVRQGNNRREYEVVQRRSNTFVNNDAMFAMEGDVELWDYDFNKDELIFKGDNSLQMSAEILIGIRCDLSERLRMYLERLEMSILPMRSHKLYTP